MLDSQEKKIKDSNRISTTSGRGSPLSRIITGISNPSPGSRKPSKLSMNRSPGSLIDDDIEFEGIWKFHEDVLVPDPVARVPFGKMYEAFVRYCAKSGRSVVEQDAFEFVFEHLENPKPEPSRGEWIGYRLRTDRD